MAHHPAFNSTPTADLLTSLREVTSQLRDATGGGSPAAPPLLPTVAPSSLLLQLAALHKGFLALSDALMEEAGAAVQHRSLCDERIESVRRELGGRLGVAAALQQDLQALAKLDASLHQQNSFLSERVQQLEVQVASLQQKLEGREAEATQALQAAVDRALDAQLERRLRGWEQERLPTLVSAMVEQQAGQVVQARLQQVEQREDAMQRAAAADAGVRKMVRSLQKACEAVSEVAASAAAESAAVSADVRQLAAWCCQVSDAHANHEQRLSHLEEASISSAAAAMAATAVRLQAASARGMSAVPAPHMASSAQPHEQMTQQAEEQQVAACPRHDPPLLQRLAQQLEAPEEIGRQPSVPQPVSSALVASLQEQLTALSSLQAEQAGATQELVQSVLADIMSLARQTKVLDSEVRSLRRALAHTQQAVLDSSATFGRALNIPPPVGPFTSFPPDP